MGNIVSAVFMIAITLLLIAAVCGVLFFGLSQSRDIADMGYTFITDTVGHSDVIHTLEVNNTIPTAACYILLKDNPEVFTETRCGVCGITAVGAELGECLKSHMHGRVTVTLTEEESGGTYIAALTAG